VPKIVNVPADCLTARELAEQLDTTPATITRWLQRGILPAPASEPGKPRYWRKAVIREFTESRRFRLTAIEQRDHIVNTLIGLTMTADDSIVPDDTADYVRTIESQPYVAVRVIRTVTHDEGSIAEGTYARLPANVATELIKQRIVAPDGSLQDLFDELRAVKNTLSQTHIELHAVMQKIASRFGIEN
jgi:Helix-turn-helix domain